MEEEEGDHSYRMTISFYAEAQKVIVGSFDKERSPSGWEKFIKLTKEFMDNRADGKIL